MLLNAGSVMSCRFVSADDLRRAGNAGCINGQVGFVRTANFIQSQVKLPKQQFLLFQSLETFFILYLEQRPAPLWSFSLIVAPPSCRSASRCSDGDRLVAIR